MAPTPVPWSTPLGATPLGVRDVAARRRLHEGIYRARGAAAGDRIKGCRPDPFAGRTSAATMRARASQLRLRFGAL